MKPALRLTSLAAYLPSLGVSVAYFAFLALFLGVAAPLTPAPVNQGDKCFRCYRTIVRTRIAGEIVDRNGLAYKFRAPACMAQYMSEHPQPADSLAGVFIADYTSGLLVPVKHAWFVETVIDPWTGERDFVAFHMRGSAEAYARKEGASVVDWTGVMTEGARRAREVTSRAD